MKNSRSAIFHSEQYHEIEQRIADLLNDMPAYLSQQTANSTRAVGDAIQAILSEHFGELLGDACAKYSARFSRRAMQDLAFEDAGGFYYAVDVKTHRTGTAFNMPNLTSARRLADFYEDDANYFVVLIVRYELEELEPVTTRVHFVPIEFLSSECLTVGALGWGQIQIASATDIRIKQQYPRRDWMLEFCDIMLRFYPAEIEKIKGRAEFFRNLRQDWLDRGHS